MATLLETVIIPRQKPKNLSEEDFHIFKNEYKTELPASKIFILKKGYILRNNIFSLQKMKFYSEYVRINRKLPKYKNLVKNLFRLFSPTQKVDKGIWILEYTLSDNYFHWLTDSLSRLFASRQFIDDHKVLLPDRYKSFSFIAESLDFLNIQYEYFDTNKKVIVSELLMPSFISEFAGFYNKDLLFRMRDTFLENYQAKPFRKIYLSRQKAPRRKILNEDELMPLFIKYGYEEHFFDDYTFTEQVKLMSESISLVTLHGAGITNILFMPENGCVLDLRDVNWKDTNYFYRLTADLGHSYYYQFDTGNNIERAQLADININPEKLNTNLGLMENELQNRDG